MPPSIYDNQGVPPTGAQPEMGGGEMPMEGGEDPQQIKAQIRQIVSQMPPDQLRQIVANPEQAMEQLMQKIMQHEDIQGDEALALQIAQLIIEEALDFAQESQNKTLGMMNPQFDQPEEGAPPQPSISQQPPQGGMPLQGGM